MEGGNDRKNEEGRRKRWRKEGGLLAPGGLN